MEEKSWMNMGKKRHLFIGEVEKREKEEEEVELGLRRMWRMGNYGLAHWLAGELFTEVFTSSRTTSFS